MVVGLNLDVTRRCNLECKYCGATLDCRSSLEGNPRELSTEKLVSILKCAGEAGARMLTIAGGEPLLRKDILEILYAAEDYGYGIGLLTNGTLIDEKMAAALAMTSIGYVRVSMESPNEEVFERFRGRGSFKKVLRGTRKLKEHGVNEGIGMTVYPENISEIPHMSNFCLSNNIDFARIIPGERIGRAKSVDMGFSHYVSVLRGIYEATVAQHLLDMSNFDYLPVPLDPASNMISACPGGTHNLYVSPTGELKICPFVPDANHSNALAPTRLANSAEDFLSFRRETKSLRNSSSSLRGKCSTCDVGNTCKGGCIAQKLVHGRDAYDEQPVCIRDVFNASLGEYFTSESCRKLIGRWLYLISTNTTRAAPWCPRQLPWWTIDLSGTQQQAPV